MSDANEPLTDTQFSDLLHYLPENATLTTRPNFTLKQLAERILSLPENEQNAPAQLLHDDRLFQIDMPNGPMGSEDQPVLTGNRFVFCSPSEARAFGWYAEDIETCFVRFKKP